MWKKEITGSVLGNSGTTGRGRGSRFKYYGTVSPESKRLRLELTEMESTAGVGVSVTLAENFRTRSSLIHFQQGLGECDLLLSFYLGKRESYLWAVTQSSIELYRLPAESEIREDIERFREAILFPSASRQERDWAQIFINGCSVHSIRQTRPRRPGCCRWMGRCSICRSLRW